MHSKPTITVFALVCTVACLEAKGIDICVSESCMPRRSAAFPPRTHHHNTSYSTLRATDSHPSFVTRTTLITSSSRAKGSDFSSSFSTTCGRWRGCQWPYAPEHTTDSISITAVKSNYSSFSPTSTMVDVATSPTISLNPTSVPAATIPTSVNSTSNMAATKYAVIVDCFGDVDGHQVASETLLAADNATTWRSCTASRKYSVLDTHRKRSCEKIPGESVFMGTGSSSFLAISGWFTVLFVLACLSRTAKETGDTDTMTKVLCFALLLPLCTATPIVTTRGETETTAIMTTAAATPETYAVTTPTPETFDPSEAIDPSQLTFTTTVPSGIYTAAAAGGSYSTKLELVACSGVGPEICGEMKLQIGTYRSQCLGFVRYLGSFRNYLTFFWKPMRARSCSRLNHALLVVLQPHHDSPLSCGYPTSWYSSFHPWRYYHDVKTVFSRKTALFVDTTTSRKSHKDSDIHTCDSSVPLVTHVTPTFVAVNPSSSAHVLITVHGRHLGLVQSVMVQASFGLEDTVVTTSPHQDAAVFSWNPWHDGRFFVRLNNSSEIRSSLSSFVVTSNSAPIRMELSSPLTSSGHSGNFRHLDIFEAQLRLASVLGLFSVAQVEIQFDNFASKEMAFTLKDESDGTLLAILRSSAEYGTLYDALGKGDLHIGRETLKILPPPQRVRCNIRSSAGPGATPAHWLGSLVLVTLCVLLGGFDSTHTMGRPAIAFMFLLLVPLVSGCPMNQYLSSESGTCVDCPADSSSPSNSTNKEACTCNPGYTGDWQFDQLSCSLCPLGTYKPTQGSASCTDCPSDTSTGRVGATSSSECICGPGFSNSSDSEGCVGCPAGYFKADSGHFGCSACVSGTWSMGNASSCQHCAAGSHTISDASASCTCDIGWTGPDGGGNECTQCPVGTFSTTTGSADCTPCPSGSTTNSTGSTSATACECLAGYESSVSGSCQSCPPGQFKMTEGAGQCSECPVGTYSSIHGATSCNHCPSGAISGSGSTDITECLCNAGWTGPDGGECTLCAVGEYKSTGGSADCTPCPSGSTTNSTGSTSATACECLAGYESSVAGSCQICPPGQFKMTEGAGQCSECAVGTYSSIHGATSCNHCPSGAISGSGSTDITECLCSAGWTGPDGGECTECSVGTYKSTTGSADCTPCPSGSTTNSTASTASTACECLAGYESSVSGSCQSCPPGQFKMTKGAGQCSECAVGTYSSIHGATSCNHCPSGAISGSGSTDITECLCSAGWTGPDGGECTFCDFGSFKTIPGSANCTVCPPNSNTEAMGSKSPADCLCLAGYGGRAGGPCVPCGAGQHKGEFGTGQCTDCSVGTYAALPTAATACLPCPANSNSAAGTGSLTGCLCEQGWGAGNRTDPSSEYCAACVPGTFKDAAGNGACTPCPTDSTTSGYGSTSAAHCLCLPGSRGPAGGPCSDCLVGEYSATLGQSACQACPEATFADNPGQSVCTACPQTQWAPEGSDTAGACTCNQGFEFHAVSSGGFLCVECDFGFFKASPGDENCEKCPGGTTTLFLGSTNASDCRHFTTAKEGCESVGSHCLAGLDILGRGVDLLQLQSTRDISHLKGSFVAYDFSTLARVPQLDGAVPNGNVPRRVTVDLQNSNERSEHSEEYSSSTQLREGWAASLNVPIKGVILTPGVRFVESASFLFRKKAMTSKILRKLFTLSLPSDFADLHPSLKEAIAALPRETYSFEPFFQLFRLYGTHMIQRVHVGGLIEVFLSQFECEYAKTKSVHGSLQVTLGKYLKGFGPGIDVTKTMTEAEAVRVRSWKYEKVGGNEKDPGNPSCVNDCGLDVWWDSLPSKPGITQYELVSFPDLIQDPTVKLHAARALNQYHQLQKSAQYDKDNNPYHAAEAKFRNYFPLLTSKLTAYGSRLAENRCIKCQ